MKRPRNRSKKDRAQMELFAPKKPGPTVAEMNEKHARHLMRKPQLRRE